MRKVNNELLVGIFMIIAFFCFATVAVKFGGDSFIEPPGYELHATFDSISGLKVGSSVEIAGVPVGRIENIQLVEGRALVHLWVDAGVKIEDDALANIRTKGLIGEKYLRITPGISEDLLEDGGEISETESVLDIEDLIGKFIYGKS